MSKQVMRVQEFKEALLHALPVRWQCSGAGRSSNIGIIWRQRDVTIHTQKRNW